MTTPLTYTVTMDARLAEQVGIPAAMLYNLLAWMSDTSIVKDYDEDGWFYLTAEDFQARTTFNRNTFTKAADALVEAGLIEKRVLCLKKAGVYTLQRRCHFRVKSRFCATDCTPGVQSMHTKCENNIYKKKKRINPGFTQSESRAHKNQVGEEHQLEQLQFPFDEATASGGKPASKEIKTESAPEPAELPFDVPTKPVAPDSLRPDKKTGVARQRDYACANEVRRRLGLKGQSSAAFKEAVKRWLEAGYEADDIVEAVEMMKDSGIEYLETATPLACLAQANMDWYEMNREKMLHQRRGADDPLPEELPEDDFINSLPLDENGRILITVPGI